MDDPPSPFKIPPAPATPLQQLSPDRINQQRIPPSPSLPNGLSSAEFKLRQSVDVQSKVAFLNSLNQGGSPTRQQGASTNAALQRALLGREEAENALRTSNTQLAEAETRQRRLSERLESLMEELQSVKERQAHERQVFEKEVRKVRKDGFRAGSALVKLQEDLKESRAEVRNLRAEVQHEKSEKEKSKQESFERAYTLAGMLEEVEVMREKMRAMEAAREAEVLEQESRRVQREEEERLLAEKRQMEEKEQAALASKALKLQQTPETQKADETMQIRQNRFERTLVVDLPTSETPMTCTRSSTPGDLKHTPQVLQKAPNAEIDEQLHLLNAELQWQKQLRIRAEEMVHFLQMECQFKICACRVAEKNGKSFVHDKEYQQLSSAEQEERIDQAEETEIHENHFCESVGPAQDAHQPDEEVFNISRQEHHQDALAALEGLPSSPSKALTEALAEVASPSMTDMSPGTVKMESSQFDPSNFSIKDASSPAMFAAEDMTYQSPLRTMTRPNTVCAIPLRDAAASPPPRSPSASPYPLTPGFKTPQRQGLRIVQAETITVMVPLRDNDDVFCPAPGTPGTPVSREAALAQIRARRDRARSVAMSTSKSAPGSARRGLPGGLRDISAPGDFSNV